jgi:hypothetical protein
VADKKASEGTLRTLALTDVWEVENPGQAVQYKTTLAALKAALESGGIAALALAAAQITSGTFADARISESSVTQHETALTITESQISDLTHTTDKTISTITQAGHGFSAGNAIGHNGTIYVKAKADLTQKCLGVVLSVDGNNFTAAWCGAQTITAHGMSVGLYYLSDAVAGALTTTQPGPGSWSQEVLQVTGANTVIVRVGEART